MTFSEFKNYIPKIEKIEFSGSDAHNEISPNFRKKNLEDIEIEKREPKNAAVTALFYPNAKNETCIVLILRNTYKGVHSAQIGFPGGREENVDNNLEDTALRETFEEVGVRPAQIKILRKLTKIYIPPSNFWVFPFMAICESTPKFKRQESEVNQILEVKLSDVLNEKTLDSAILSTSYAQNVSVPAFLLNDQIVWGATGMMLNEVKGIIKDSLTE